VIAAERDRLLGLQGWVSGSGGPVEGLAASIGSLDPLWEWFEWFVAQGMPRVPVGSRRVMHPGPDGQGDSVRALDRSELEGPVLWEFRERRGMWGRHWGITCDWCACGSIRGRNGRCSRGIRGSPVGSTRCCVCS
jgi:hypothetical protein